MLFLAEQQSTKEESKCSLEELVKERDQVDSNLLSLVCSVFAFCGNMFNFLMKNKSGSLCSSTLFSGTVCSLNLG